MAAATTFTGAHRIPTSPRSAVDPHRNPTDETEHCGIHRNGCYDGLNGGWPAAMLLSWAAECFAVLASGRDRAPEKRKVGGSTPPLTTSLILGYRTADLVRRCQCLERLRSSE